MEVNKKPLGKVTITLEGEWDKNREYERLCLVHDGEYASYMSKKYTPSGTILQDNNYWQPIASLNDDIKFDYITFKKEVIKALSELQIKLKGSRIVVKTLEDRDNLTYKDIVAGCKVYVFDINLEYICRSINPISNEKTWIICANSNITSEPSNELNGLMYRFVAHRSFADEDGHNIKATYVKYEAINNYISYIINNTLYENMPTIYNKAITVEMLSDSVLQLIGHDSIVNFPDDEDLTTINNKLKFKDKQYNINNFSGLGRKILRKNMVDGINILTQSMINEPNTIYILQYNYCLDGKTITIPENSTIIYFGGKLYNGKLNLNKSIIIGNNGYNSIIGDIEIDNNFGLYQRNIDIENGLTIWNGNKFI